MNESISPTSAGGASEKSVQRRKRTKFMEIQEFTADGEAITRTVVAPKGIYKTPHGYRVQLNMESVGGVASKLKPLEPHPSNGGISSALVASKGKFSRNTKKFDEAVWLYEAAILISDLPSSVETIAMRGNYGFMINMGVSPCAILSVNEFM